MQYLVAISLLCSLSSAWAMTTEEVSNKIRFPVEKYQLDNGLTVLLHEDHSAPTVSLHQWYRVGSSYEKPGQTGLAHFFEHMMFKGTKKFPGEDFNQLVQGSGGSNNAFTSKDYTGYFVNIPPDKLELMLDIESDRMRNLIINEQVAASEREVVKEERRYSVENSIPGTMSEAIFKTVFKVAPYRWPVIGYMKDLNRATVADLKEFYRIHYAPNNGVLVIAGAINKSKVKSWVKKYYGPLKSQVLPETKFSQEPKQRGMRQVTLKRDVQASRAAVAFKVSKSGEADSFALDLLSTILGGGKSSRLYKRLVYRNQTVASTYAYAYTPKLAGIFQVGVSMKPGQDLDKALALVYQEIWKLRNRPVTDKELEKAKNNIIYDYVKGLKTINGKANALAINEILFGDYTEIFRDLGRYSQVTKEDLQRVAKTYLLPQRRNVVKVLPKKEQVQ